MAETHLNPGLYSRSVRIADSKYKTHSAYRSAFIAKTYRDLHGRTKATRKHGLRKWINEEWKNLTPYVEGLASSRTAYKCGERAKNQKGRSICRPKKDVNKYTRRQLRKAVAIKNRGKTINWRTL